MQIQYLPVFHWQYYLFVWMFRARILWKPVVGMFWSEVSPKGKLMGGQGNIYRQQYYVKLRLYIIKVIYCLTNHTNPTLVLVNLRMNMSEVRIHINKLNLCIKMFDIIHNKHHLLYANFTRGLEITNLNIFLI